jgi:hypothetical protein
MPIEIHESHAPVELILRGELTVEDVDALVAGADKLRRRPSRPGIVVDATRATPTSVMWSQSRRDAMREALQAVGCIAIVATEAATVHAAKVALDPLGSEVVWRVFGDLESARIWVFSVERLAQSVWSTQTEPSFVEHRVTRLSYIIQNPPLRGREKEELKRERG